MFRHVCCPSAMRIFTMPLFCRSARSAKLTHTVAENRIHVQRRLPNSLGAFASGAAVCAPAGAIEAMIMAAAAPSTAPRGFLLQTHLSASGA